MTRNHLITVAALGIFSMVMTLLNLQFIIGKLSPANQSLFNLATNIMLLHTVALFAMTFMNRYLSRTNLRIIFYFFSLGSVLFALPLYLMATDEVTNIVLGILKPASLLGGFGLLLGWFMVLYTGFTYKHKKRSIHNQA